MANSWTSFGVDLLLPLEPGPGRRIVLERALRGAIRTGRLQAGTRLPSSRALALELGLARGTVVEAYAQLAAEGYLTARQGSATRVAHGATTVASPTFEPRVSTAPRFDFRGARPNLAAFPRSLWLAATRRALRTASSYAFDYGDPRGQPELREVLASYLARARGVQTSPDRIVVCNGFAQCLAILTQALRKRGASSMALEDPGVPSHRRIVAANGLSVKPLPVDHDGAQVGALAGLGVDAVVLTPVHQAPLGVSLQSARRAEVLNWSCDSGGLIIEDDYDGEFRFDRQPVGALQGVNPRRVVYAGTASKTLMPGIRLAWLVVPPDLLDPVTEAKWLADRHTGAIDQLTLAELIQSGAFDRHVRRMRAQYRHRRDHLVRALAEHVPELQPIGIAGGVHLVLELPGGWPAEDELIKRAAERGIALLGMNFTWHNPASAPPAIIVGYSTPPDHAFIAGVRELVDLLASCSPKPSRRRQSGSPRSTRRARAANDALTMLG